MGIAGAEPLALPGPVGALPRLELPAAKRKLSRGVLDVAAIVLGLLVAVRGRWHMSALALILLIAAYPLAVRWMLTRKAPVWDDGSLSDELRLLAVATSLPALTLIGADAILRGGGVVPLALRIWLFTLALLVIGRIVLHYIRVSSPQAASWPTLIVGAGRVGGELARLLRAEPQHGLEPVGFLDYEPAPAQAQPVPHRGPWRRARAASARKARRPTERDRADRRTVRRVRIYRVRR